MEWGVGATARPYLQVEAAEPRWVFASRAAGGPWEQSFRRAWSQTTGLPANPYMWASSNGGVTVGSSHHPSPAAAGVLLALWGRVLLGREL